MILNNDVYDHLLTGAPQLLKSNKTFFDISGNENREVVISRWYKYFLESDKDHGLGTLFIDALMQLTGDAFKIGQFTVHIEQKTIRGNFIDILVKGIGKDHGKSVIIENKIHHYLHNDLDDYWAHCTGDADKKVGVLLTLKPEPVRLHRNFQNILHIHWINRVCEEVEMYTLSGEQKFLFYSFINTIKNLNRYSTMNNNYSYYFKNTEAINNLIIIKEESRKYVIHQLESAARHLDMTLLYEDSPRLRGFDIAEFESELGCTVIFGQVFEPGNELRIVVGLTKKNLSRVHELDEVFAAEIDRTDLVRNDYPGHGWHNYLTKRYALSELELNNLETFVANEIKMKFLPLARRIGEYLKVTEPDVLGITAR